MAELADTDQQLVELLEVLGDEATYRILRRLLDGHATASDLVDPDVKGLDQSGVSRRLKTLRSLGVVVGRGRSARFSIVVREEVLSILKAVVGLADALNELRIERSQAAGRELEAQQH